MQDRECMRMRHVFDHYTQNNDAITCEVIRLAIRATFCPSIYSLQLFSFGKQAAIFSYSLLVNRQLYVMYRLFLSNNTSLGGRLESLDVDIAIAIL